MTDIVLESKESQHFFDYKTEDSSTETMCCTRLWMYFCKRCSRATKKSVKGGLSQEIGLAPISTLVHEALATTQKKHSMPQH